MNKAALAELGQFSGTEQYHKLPPFGMVVSDGVLFLAQNADCFWLLNQIAILQHNPKIKNDLKLQEMQFWTLKSHSDGGANLICERDTNDVAMNHPIGYTDFPFDALPNPRIWVAPTSLDGETTVQVAYLPSEH